MAKRLTDTDKWKKPFIKSLPAEYKLFWIYLTDDINHAGIWEVDKEVTEIRLGIKLSFEKALGLFKEKVVVFDNGTKWFLPDFIKFQYGTLNNSSTIHKSVISLLTKYNLIEHVKGLLTLKDKDKVKDKEELEREIKEKKQNFKNSLEPFRGAYTDTMLLEFINYWGEAQKSGRLKWELEETWELKLRLKRWIKNEDKFSK